MTADRAASDLVDLGACDACSLGCAVACADGRSDRAHEARRVLIGSGVSLVLLTVVPGLAGRHVAVLGLGALGATLGLLVSVLAGVAVRAGRPAGDRPARIAFRLLPLGVAVMASTWLGAVAVRLL